MGTTPKQRMIILEVCDYLRGDLYARSHCDDDVDAFNSAQWRSPLGWSVIYTPRKDGTGLVGEIRDPDGEMYRATSNLDVQWLDEFLP